MDFRHIESNGIRMRVAVAGESGPTLLFAHGWPESWYSWRHQLAEFARRGYRVLAPDMRGYGGTDAPPDVAAYDAPTLCADLTGVLDAFGADSAVLIGHDWGAIIGWQAALRHPRRFSAFAALSVPYVGKSRRSPMAVWRDKFGDNFFYILYHNEADGSAEREYDADPRGLLSRLLLSPDSPRAPPPIQDRRRAAGGWIGRLGAPTARPEWLTDEDLDYYVAEFTRRGFRGGINYYRNFHRNWELSLAYPDEVVRVPAIFIAGERDAVINGASAEELRAKLQPVVADLRGVELLSGIGHWVQQEAPERTNRLLNDFLNGL